MKKLLKLFANVVRRQKTEKRTMSVNKHLYIGAAHDKVKVGATYGDLNEYGISLDVHQGIEEVLKAAKIPYTILLGTLAERIAIVSKRPDVGLYLEPHCNDLPANTKARGYFIMVQSGNELAEKYAKMLLEKLAPLPIPRVKSGICFHDNGHCWFADGPSWLRGTISMLQDLKIPAILVEMCYLSNEMDRMWIAQREHRLLYGNAIGRGLVEIWKNITESK